MSNPKLPPQKAKLTDPQNLLPQRQLPFSLSAWNLAAKPPLKVRVDDVVNLLPLQAFQPFNQFDWSRPRTQSKKAAVDDFINLLPLQEEPGLDLPFTQFDWSNPALRRSSAAARDQIPSGGSVGPIPPSFKGFEWLARARRRNRR